VKDDIIRMWNEGKVSGEIARELHTTRNVVMGVVYRAQKQGLAVKKGPSEPPPPKPKAVVRLPDKKVSKHKGVVVRKDVLGKKIGPAPVELPPTPEVVVKTMPKRLLQLGAYDCRWTVKDGYFCGAPSKSMLRPWCEEHYKLVYVPVNRSKKAPFRLVSRAK